MSLKDLLVLNKHFFRHDTIWIRRSSTKSFFLQHVNTTSDATEVCCVNSFLESSWLTRGSRGSWTHASERSARRDRPHTSEPACWWSWRSEEKIQELHVHILCFFSIQYVYFICDICSYITGPMLIHLVKLSSAWMCSYSSLTAFPLSVVLWWASYTFNTTAGEQEQSHRVRSDSQSNFKGKPYFTSSYHCRKTSCRQGNFFFFPPIYYLTLEFNKTFVCHQLYRWKCWITVTHC